MQININNLPEQQEQRTCSLPIEIKLGTQIGIGKVIADVLVDGMFLSREGVDAINISNSIATHMFFQGFARCNKEFKATDSFEEITTFVKDFVSCNIGGVCALLSKNGAGILSTHFAADKISKKLINDFTFMSIFVSTQMLNKNYIMTQVNKVKCIDNFEKNKKRHIKHIDNSVVKFFTDVVSSAMGSIAIAYISPLITTKDDNWGDVARNGLILGSVFSVAKNITHNFLTRGYNCITGNKITEELVVGDIEAVNIRPR
jgi:hypothetical protein